MGKRAQAFPDVPTMAESRFADFDASTWNVLYAPASTPKPVIDHVFKYVLLALADPDVISRQPDVGVEPTPDTTPDKAAAFRQKRIREGGTACETVRCTRRIKLRPAGDDVIQANPLQARSPPSGLSSASM